MSSKSNTEVIIGGRVYTLSGYEGEEYLQRVAAYINNKINEFQDMEGVRSLTPDMKATLLEINIADDYFKAKERVDRLEQSLEQKEKELYDIKHELIAAKIEAESAEKNRKELEQKNKELLLNKAKLETALEDALLGAGGGNGTSTECRIQGSCRSCTGRSCGRRGTAGTGRRNRTESRRSCAAGETSGQRAYPSAALVKRTSLKDKGETESLLFSLSGETSNVQDFFNGYRNNRMRQI